jgi:sarcosine oxidase
MTLFAASDRFRLRAESMAAWDVIVAGLGGMGSAAAFHLARRGQRVLGIDSLRPPHDRGSSHGSTRVIRQAYFEHPAYVPMLLRAYELWRELERVSDQELLCLPGGLMMGMPDSEVVQGSLRSAQTHGLPHETLDTGDVRRRFPQFRIPDGAVALLERAAGLVHCERAVAAHLAGAERHGATLRLNTSVVAWESGPAGVEVITPAGRFTAGRLILAPGPWAPGLLAATGVPLRVERQVLAWFQPPAGIDPFRPDRFPIYIWQGPDGALPYGFPAIDGNHGGVKIALYRTPREELCSPETVDRRIRPDDENALRAVIRDFIPALDGPLVAATTCLYTLTPDLHFIIDRHPAASNVVIAAGFSGHGFKFCSVVGEILADLATGRATAFDLSLFRIDRFAAAERHRARGEAGPPRVESK